MEWEGKREGKRAHETTERCTGSLPCLLSGTAFHMSSTQNRLQILPQSVCHQISGVKVWGASIWSKPKRLTLEGGRKDVRGCIRGKMRWESGGNVVNGDSREGGGEFPNLFLADCRHEAPLGAVLPGRRPDLALPHHAAAEDG
jgi:hypothetical protein